MSKTSQSNIEREGGGGGGGGAGEGERLEGEGSGWGILVASTEINKCIRGYKQHIKSDGNNHAVG